VSRTFIVELAQVSLPQMLKNRPDASANSSSTNQRAGSHAFALFNGGASGGIVFRPGVTKINCGKAADSSGHCGARCPASRNKAEVPWNEAADKLCAWAPQDFGVSLRRITEHQIEYKRLWYNEIIIDAKHWRSHLPDQVEAIFNNPENHRRFLAAFPHLTPESHPHVLLDATNWHSPFSMDHPDGDG